MWRIGMTGSIATGKSTVLRAFAAHGVPVFSADEAVAELYKGVAVPAIEEAFPGTTSERGVDKAALSRLLIADPTGFAKLEAIVHPLVRSRISQFFADAERAGHALAVVEIPLLFESGHDYGLDAIAVTWVDPAIQRERALARPGMSGEKLDTILARQLPQDDKKARASYLFDTGRPLEETRNMVAALVAAIRARNAKP